MHPGDFGSGYFNLAKTFDTLFAASRVLTPPAGPPYAHPLFSPLFPPPPPQPQPHGVYPFPFLPLLQTAPSAFPVLGNCPVTPRQSFSPIPAAENSPRVVRSDDDEEGNSFDHV